MRSVAKTHPFQRFRANVAAVSDLRLSHYAVLQTGPSATADIEGVLIHGAQGVRSLSVLLIGRTP